MGSVVRVVKRRRADADMGQYLRYVRFQDKMIFQNLPQPGAVMERHGQTFRQGRIRGFLPEFRQHALFDLCQVVMPARETRIFALFRVIGLGPEHVQEVGGSFANPCQPVPAHGAVGQKSWSLWPARCWLISG